MVCDTLVPFLSQYSVIDLLINVILIFSGYLIRDSILFGSVKPSFSTFSGELESNETLSYGSLCFLTFGIGSLVVIVIWMVLFGDIRVFKAVNYYIFSISLTILISSIMGRLFSRPKPNTVHLCGSDVQYSSCNAVLPQKLLLHQFSSFPSVHSSESAAASVFLCLLLSELWESSSLFAAVFKASPILFTIFVMASRIWDKQSYFDDIVAGLFVGSFAAYISFTSFKREISLVSNQRNNGQTDTSSFPLPRYN